MKKVIEDLRNHPNLKVFKQHGFIPKGVTSDQVFGYSIFGNTNKMFINPEIKTWDCKSSGLEGGYQEWLQQVHKFSLKHLTDNRMQWLKDKRGLSKATLEYHAVGWNPGNSGYTIPVFDENNENLLDLRMYKIVKGKWMLLSSAGTNACLYGYERLQKFKTVWLVEGHFDKMAMWEILYKTGKLEDETTWAAPGAQTFKNSWVDRFKNKVVYNVYDADRTKMFQGVERPGAGPKGSYKVQTMLGNLPKKIKFVNWPAYKKDGFDTNDLLNQIPEHKKAYRKLKRLLKDDSPLEEKFRIEIKKKVKTNHEITEDDKTKMDKHFVILGRNEGTHYFLLKKNLTVVTCKTSGIERNFLFDLMPRKEWMLLFPKSDGDYDKEKAIDFIIQESKKYEGFNPDNIRGRGAWLDNDRVVIHLGNSLKVDGITTPISDIDSDYIYMKGNKIDIGGEKSLSTKESKKYFDLCTSLHWEKENYGVLLAGFTVVAAFSGVLPWRSHIWVTGGHGNGKSWVLRNTIERMLRGYCIVFAGDSTASGVQQTLRFDALPIIHDEAEAKSPTARMKMEKKIEILRQASDANDKTISVRGTPGGRAYSNRIRSCACLASIGVSAEDGADKSRFSFLRLKSLPENPSYDHRKEFSDKELFVNDNFTEKYSSGFLSRVIDLIPVILHNAKMFKVALTMLGCGGRESDQIGTLVAGAYSLVCDDALTKRQARKFIKNYNLHKIDKVSKDSDEMALLNIILCSEIRSYISGVIDGRTVEELCKSWICPPYAKQCKKGYEDDIKLSLSRKGLLINKDGLCISNNHTAIETLLSKHSTPYKSSWKSGLVMLPGARKTNPQRFKGLLKKKQQRAIFIPFEVFLDMEKLKKDKESIEDFAKNGGK